MGQQESTGSPVKTTKGIAPWRHRVKYKWFLLEASKPQTPVSPRGAPPRPKSVYTKAPAQTATSPPPQAVKVDDLRKLNETEALQFLTLAYADLASEIGESFHWDQERTIQRWCSTLQISPGGLDWETFDKNLYRLIRGSGIEDIPLATPTILAFVNPSSGGGQGVTVIRDLRNFLPADQTSFCSLSDRLAKWIQYPNLKIVVAGGDGTVCWILSILDKLKVEFQPAIAILPLGTGNDTARVMGWGGGYGGEPMSDILRSVCNSEIFDFDRWKITIKKLKEGENNEWTNQINEDQTDRKDTEGSDEEISEPGKSGLVLSGKSDRRAQEKRGVSRGHGGGEETDPNANQSAPSSSSSSSIASPRSLPESHSEGRQRATGANTTATAAAAATAVNTAATPAQTAYPTDLWLPTLDDLSPQPQETTQEQTQEISSVPPVPFRVTARSAPPLPITASPLALSSPSNLTQSSPSVKPSFSSPLTQSSPASSYHLSPPPPLPPRTHATQTESPSTPTTGNNTESIIANQEETMNFVSNNYFSIGFDSQLLYQFEQLRQENPNLFVSRHTNYLVYGMLGMKHMMSVSHFTQKSLRHYCKLYVDGVPIPIPFGLHCLVVLNIPSYCGGANPWASSSNGLPGELPQSISDGVIEIFGLKAQLGLTKANLRKGGIRVAQGSHVQIVVVQPIACQVDGEAHMIGPSEITLKLHSRVHMCFNTEKEHRRNMLRGTN